MQFTATLATLLATGLVSAAPSGIKARQCTPSTELLTFDEIFPISVNTPGLSILPANSADVTVQNLTPESAPNLAFTGAASGWPPVIPSPHSIEAADDDSTFEVRTYYKGGGSGTHTVMFGTRLDGTGFTNVITSWPSGAAVPQDGGLTFYNLTALAESSTQYDFTGLHSWGFTTYNGNFQIPHALDNVELLWEC